MSQLAHIQTSDLLAEEGSLPPEPLGLELPPDLHVAAFDISDLGAVIEALSGFCSESELPARFARKRRAEYLAGRCAASRALSELGIGSRVGRAMDGLPAWPPGVVGSITHGAGVACAAVALADRYRALGIDIERVLEDAESSELWPSIAHTDELLLLKSALPYTRLGQRLSVLFSAKESLFKALFPLTHEFLEFCDVRLVSVGMGSRYQGLLMFRLERSIDSEFASGSTYRARFFLGPERIESAVMLRSG
ncbi:MAG TPA: 4'-phosphopantetheinyl transferase superfamily protein [Polyangiaceae bacterium]|jgi:enterobactin synthetase component D|nr:4'-phosphopantetheinyl transferase superfamily protein [Polyangiaceae bacterium]